MSLEEKFSKAAEDIKNLKSSPSNEDLLEIYALYKQGTVGDVNTSQPGVLDMKGRAKWNSWSSKKGLSKDSAMQQYISKAEALINAIGLK